jgi:hypothetical protein
MEHHVDLGQIPIRQQAACRKQVKHRLLRLLKRANHTDLRRLRVHLVVSPDEHAPPRWAVRLRIKLDQDQEIVTVAGAELPGEGLRIAFDQIERRVQERLRSRQGRRRAHKARRSAATRAAENDACREGVDPILPLEGLKGFLVRTAREELKSAEEDEQLPWCPLSLDDLVDETMVRALERWDQRPSSQRLEDWLVGILRRILAEEIDRQCQEAVVDFDDASSSEEDDDPRRDVRRWRDAPRDPGGLSLWDGVEYKPGKNRRVA